ncbi:MAG: AEC family transporter [Luteolibacter sp.]|nr:AEC family transporter [Luteolibacter sp.]
MISPWDVLGSVLPIYLLLVAGSVLRWTGVLSKGLDEGVMRVVYTIMLPAFMLDKILGSEALRSGSVVLGSIALGFGLMLAGTAIGMGVGRVIGLERGTGMRTFGLASGCQNFGFTAVPVVQILWSTSALAILFVHNIGCELAMWTVGVMVMSAERGIPWRRMVNGPVIAVLGGLLLVALGWDVHCTGPARRALSMIGVGAIPLAVLITGCTIADLVAAERPSTKIILGSSLVRLVLAPLVFLAAAKYLPIATELRQVLVVQASMPAAVTPIMLARMYGGRTAIAAQIVVFTTGLSLFSLPWIITLGCRWIGLHPLLP